MKEDKYVHTSRPYSLVSDQFQHWNAEAERYKILTESLQVSYFLFNLIISSTSVVFAKC